ncbi:hypothetical protein CU102_22480 [Phyllobacterium brassicacearum]|uniref:Uncharacterized protein n=1 Tax=Phyllobacterium brassicacearum TaxID=314235 RepID=A0A2P7BCU4_9HYPH|nr:hypothetical protein [Phyllobacterium brassicacearum]PSH64283.1 hypothetical protein CU102_22480 [Phyllobacterium brassicacearum]TDQ12832.1 hypothetical protein DEV91_1475 [Phyllobacterium brassicacearum]
MNRLARIFAIVLLAVFAAGTVADAANVTSMSLAMSPAAMADGDMGDCDGCPPGNEGKASRCGQICLAPFAAIPAAAGFELAVMAADVAASPAEEITGSSGLPDPPPPRTIVL